MNRINYYYNQPDQELQIDIWDSQINLLHHEDVISDFHDEEDMRETCLNVASQFGRACFQEDLDLLENCLLYLQCSQRELAKRLHIGTRTLEYWLSGERIPSYANRQLIKSLK